MLDVFFVGQLQGAEEFRRKELFCSWRVIAGPHWQHVEGETFGQTHIMADPETTVWAHPIDVHYRTPAIQGWPRILLQVYSQDHYNRPEVCGYGVAYLPPRGACRPLQVVTWTLQPSLWQQLRQLLLGGSEELSDETLLHSMDERHRLHTRSSGTVLLTMTTAVRS
eukprot:EG_transcript_35205